VKYDTEATAAAAVAGLEGKEVEGRQLHAAPYEKRRRTRKPLPVASGSAAPDGAKPAQKRKSAPPKTDAPPHKPDDAKPADPKIVWIGGLPENTTGKYRLNPSLVVSHEKRLRRSHGDPMNMRVMQTSLT
jgi:hypothetical protein